MSAVAEEQEGPKRNMDNQDEAAPVARKRQKVDEPSAADKADKADKSGGMDWAALLGSKLLAGSLDAGWEELDTQTALQGKKVAIYFSAHWCPPCRRFTPLLKEYYEKMDEKEKAQTEVVFCSSDHDLPEFEIYFDEHPWKAIPYQAEELRQKLNNTYQVKGVPHLVTLASEGNIITTNGVKLLQHNPALLWDKPKPLWHELGDEWVQDNKGTKTQVATLVKDADVVGLYFSAHWCGPCRQFTPKLAEFYNKLKGEGKKFEVIFCSSDSNEEAFKDYFASMPWHAFDFSDRALKDQLSEQFEIEGIPALVLVDPQGHTITKQGKLYINEPEEYPWTGPPKPLQRINGLSLGAINESPVFLVVVASESEEQEVKPWLTALAQEYVDVAKAKKEPALKFLYGGVHPLVSQIKAFLKVDSPHCMLFTDLQKGAKWLSMTETEVNEKNARTLLESYFGDKSGLVQKSPKQ
eukprot:g67555.t1